MIYNVVVESNLLNKTTFFLFNTFSLLFLFNYKSIFGKNVVFDLAIMLSDYKKRLIYKPQKIQLSLTIQFAAFFIIVAGLIYFYVSNKFEEEVLDKYKFKAEMLTNFVKQNPQFFLKNKIDDKTQLIQLMSLNDVPYLVLENKNGVFVDAVNLDVAEYYLYVAANNDDNISFDETVYRVVMPITIDGVQEGKVYIGFNAGLVASDLKKKTLLTALFSLSILLAGMVFTYFLSSISFRPITKLISALSKSDIKEQKILLTKFKNDEIGVLAHKIYNILNELDKSSSEVTNLNEKLNELFREKISELDIEISHRKKAESFLKKTEEMFRQLFENAPIGMLIISPEGKIVKANKAFSHTVGYDELEIVGAPTKTFFDSNHSPKVKSTYNMIMESDNLDIECNLSKRDGRKITALIKTIKVNDEDGEPINTLLQVLDITQIKKVQAELIHALDKAKESDRLKSAFLAQMSHEIRTPLNVILPSIPILADEIGDKDRELVTILNAVGNASKRLQRTIDMILSMSAVQSGNYKARYETFSLAEDLGNLTEEFKPVVDEKGLKLSFINKSSSPEISADRYTVGQVFQNLIGNAIKYTHVGQVTVSIEDYGENKIIVKVKDTGIGISEKYLKNLFSPFSQEDAGQTRKYEGNGLGLALVKEYVTLNKGQISVQ
ncbi:MAG: PAS domain-containing sensor histidine kinase, partial [Ignavibacteriaceae bacterium]|nr:PAS domain-containing sensor histidine kinase [Ignavibacteriaceae bacterium]